jgi:hypothetical protein
VTSLTPSRPSTISLVELNQNYEYRTRNKECRMSKCGKDFTVT